ncbi:Protein kinase-like domain [Pseudocohnilembus persalinus]|uniref:Protein kinase-like domain n=1 Tax=Pseudocohnilembus persalinus TaxID=266149 RepID=A0A0V0QLX0_PSEPJ|nr:Protein kinase-like domain [Pseudocohnilembus persalinus]|eukprot:KRX03159.1 Protein kinase-like domain [Pseudocohnilembus persalinus]
MARSVMNERNLLGKIDNGFMINMKWAFQDREYLYLVMDQLTGGDLDTHMQKHKFTEKQAQFCLACLILALEYLREKKIIHRDIKPQNIVFDDKGYLRLTDMGIAKPFKQNNSGDTSGTALYMAPEVPIGWSLEAADFINKLLQRKPKDRLGYYHIDQIKLHPWFNKFDWDKLQKKLLKPSYVPKVNKQQETQNNEDQSTQLQDQISALNSDILDNPKLQQQFAGYEYYGFK